MATRPVYFIRSGQVREREVELEWFAGFAISQKQKSVNSLKPDEFIEYHKKHIPAI